MRLNDMIQILQNGKISGLESTSGHFGQDNVALQKMLSELERKVKLTN